MAISGNMESPLPVAATIKAIGLPKLTKATGLPFSTLYRWQQEDRIPGRGALRELRVKAFTEAVEKIRAEERPPPKPRKRAA